MTVMDSGIALCEAWILINKWKSGKKLRFFWGDGKARTSSMKKNLGCGFMVSLVQSAAGQKGFFGTESGLEGDTQAGKMFGTVVWFSGKNMLQYLFFL